MNNLVTLIKDLIALNSEEEWFDFKENWIEPIALGEYISALSNSAAMSGQDYGYLIWGINDQTHEIVGTTFDFYQDIKHEPLQHFLARQLTPDIAFEFHEVTIEHKRLVVLLIPAASHIPTAFKDERFLRIGSSKVKLNRYPDREAKLFSILKDGFPTIENEESSYQDLTFHKLFLYYADKGITLSQRTFKKNLGFLTKDGKYNLLAQLLSDDNHIPIRVSIFNGLTKADPLYSVREFGNTCLLLSLDKVLEYGDVLNIRQADESKRIVERKEIPLFNPNAYREAIVNAFVHNQWVDKNAPMITIYNNRMEILSWGSLPPRQTIEGFYMGESIPVNQKLSDIFLQLHISERSGRGVPTITSVYGREAYDFRENSIMVTIPFSYISETSDNASGNERGNKWGNKWGNKNYTESLKLNPTQQRILEEIRNNPNVTEEQLTLLVGIGESTVARNIAFLKENGLIERVGSKKNGWWQVN